MSQHVYQKVQLVGSSKTGIEDAVAGALAEAAKTYPNIRWFKVLETRGQVEDGKVAYWQVTIAAGSTLSK